MRDIVILLILHFIVLRACRIRQPVFIENHNIDDMDL